MGILMLKCPKTGLEFSTGIQIERESFGRLPNTVTKAACPNCGEVHGWWTKEARLADNADQVRRSA